MSKNKLLIVDTISKEVLSSGFESVLETYRYKNDFGIFNMKEFVIQGRNCTVDKTTFRTKAVSGINTYTFTYNAPTTVTSTQYYSGITGTTLVTTLTFSATSCVYKNGLLLRGSGNDYTLSGSTLTFVDSLVATDVIAIVGATSQATSAGWTLTYSSTTTTVSDISTYGITLSDTAQSGDIIVVVYDYSTDTLTSVTYKQNIVLYVGQSNEEFDYIDFFCDTPITTTFSELVNSAYKDFCQFGCKCCIEKNGSDLKITGLFTEAFDTAKATLFIAKKG